MTSTVIPFELLQSCDLIKGATYKGGIAKNFSSEPTSRILPVGNQSGIRFTGTSQTPSIVVLYTTFNDQDWPDEIAGAKLVYYGDNKNPGTDIHDVAGNQVIRTIFETYHIRKQFPLILLFSKGAEGFDRIFHGVLKPGYDGLTESEDLIAIWKTKNGSRFQNYKATFEILDIQVVERKYIKSITER